jgi:hypothetical protein
MSPQRLPLCFLGTHEIIKQIGCCEIAVMGGDLFADAESLKEIIHLGEVERIHVDALVGRKSQQAFGRQPVERLAHRGPA